MPITPLFEDLPQVELLQWLARGSLKQNLLRAVWLRAWRPNLEVLLPRDLRQQMAHEVAAEQQFYWES